MDILGVSHALEQLPQRHLGGTGNLVLLLRLLALVEVDFSRLTRCIPARVWCFGIQARGTTAASPTGVLDLHPRLADLQRLIVIVRALHQHRVFARYPLLVCRRTRAAVVSPRCGHAALGLAPGDAASQLAYLVDI